jgi:NADPH-dependent 2,4-dienoyl-CoA reductase/sulfur reductase-like enzyme
MSRHPTTVIVGASIGAVRTAQALRAEGYAGEIVLVGGEAALPYDKPPLSKAFLAGTVTHADITLLDDTKAAVAGIQLRLGRAATGLDLAGRSVELADGARLGFDELVIATGARARPSPWGERPGVHTVRTAADAVALREDLARGGPLVIVGAGFIGAEIAATATAMGTGEVTLVDPVAVPLSRVLNPAVAERFGRLHTDRGVRTRFGVGVTGIEGRGSGLRVVLADGTELPAATVVVGIGSVPNDEWLRGSGLTIEDGVVCDRFSQAAEHVHAVGDVARWFHPRHRRLVRAEHWTNAVEQANQVAHHIVHPGDPRTHEPVEYVWSDQYDWKIQLAGRTGGDLGHVVVPGADPERTFAVLYADPGGDFAGAVTVNWPRALITSRKALTARATFESVRETLTAQAMSVPMKGGTR